MITQNNGGVGPTECITRLRLYTVGPYSRNIGKTGADPVNNEDLDLGEGGGGGGVKDLGEGGVYIPDMLMLTYVINVIEAINYPPTSGSVDALCNFFLFF